MISAVQSKTKLKKNSQIHCCQILLEDCLSDLISSESHLKEYVDRLLKLMSARSYGACHLVYFGSHISEKGFSLFQLIDKGHIAAHFYHTQKYGIVDIVFCKAIDSAALTEFSRLFFEAKKGQY